MNEKPGYRDENPGGEHNEGGSSRLPAPHEEGKAGLQREEPYPGKENRADSDFERPDEFGDGDRRS